MKFVFAEFFSRVFTKNRKQYRFTGIVIGNFAIGFTWPSVVPKSENNQSELPLTP